MPEDLVDVFAAGVEAVGARGRSTIGEKTMLDVLRAPELGMMVEVPAAALTIADFSAAIFSIGTNDCTQYLMACDRTNGAVSHLVDPMSPAILELIRRVVGHGRASGRNVSLSGDIAGDPRHTSMLLNCGLREFSMSPNSLVAVKNAIFASLLEAGIV